MSLISTVRNRFEGMVRWSARGLGVLAVGMVLLFAAGEGVPNPLHQPPTVIVSLGCFLGIVLGLIAAWRWEILGAAASLLCFAGFQVVELEINGRPAWNGTFLLVAAPGVLFLFASAIGGWKKQRSGPIGVAL